MAEFYFFRMEIETVGTSAIEDITFDGTSQTIGMSAMDA